MQGKFEINYFSQKIDFRALTSQRHKIRDADDHDTHIKIACEALEACGFDTSLTVQESIQNLLEDNQESFTPMPLTSEFWTQHDLSHVFANAVNGNWNEESPAVDLQAQLFSDDFTKRPSLGWLSSEYSKNLVAQRARVLGAIFTSVSGGLKPVQIEIEALARLPIALFGMVADYNASTPHKRQYRLMSTDERQAFIWAYQGLAMKRGVTPNDIDDIALEAAPERLPAEVYMERPDLYNETSFGDYTFKSTLTKNLGVTKNEPSIVDSVISFYRNLDVYSHTKDK